MPRGVYSRDGEFTNNDWSDEQNEWLRARCLTAQSYGTIARAFNEAFPDTPKTRNAIMGRAARLGLSQNKPGALINKARSRVELGERRRRKPITPEAPLAPVVFGEPLEPRNNAPQIPNYRYATKAATRIEEAQAGFLPSIIETAPLSTVPLLECPSNGCRWPTADATPDTPFMVCGAPQMNGRSYCTRHAQFAYRTPYARTYATKPGRRSSRWSAH